MSSSDQAKSKLLDSMRLSKQGSTAKTSAENKPVEAKETKPAASSSKATSATKKSKTSSAKTSSTKTNGKSDTSRKPVTDDFQAAERVWPD